MTNHPDSGGPRAAMAGARTATAPSPAAPPAGGTTSSPTGEEPLGSLAVFLGQLFLVGAVFVAFDVYPLRPAVAAVLVGPALGCVLLAPRSALLRARVSMPILFLLVWMAMSWTWSASPSETAFVLRVQLPLLLAAMAVAGLLSTRQVVGALLLAIRLVVVLVAASLVLDPATRTGTNPGWHGTFIHKNTMAAFMVFGLATTLAFDRSRLRWPTVAATGVLIVGSQSATGLSGGVLVVVLYAWLLLHRRAAHEPGMSSALVLASVGLAATAVVGIVANLSSILAVYGKDPDFSGRTTIWSAVLDAVADRPLVGYGLEGLLRANVPTPTTLEIWNRIGDEATHAHNGVLDLVAQIGLVGLALYVVVFASTAALAVATLRRCTSVATWATLVLAAQALMSLSENVLLGPWLLVLIVIRTPLLRCRYDREAPPPERLPPVR